MILHDSEPNNGHLTPRSYNRRCLIYAGKKKKGEDRETLSLRTAFEADVADDDEDTEIKFSVFSLSGELVCVGINTGAIALFDYNIEPSHTLVVSHPD